MTGLAGMTNGPVKQPASPNDQPKLMAHPRRGIRAAIFGTADSPRHRAPTPRDCVVLLLVVFAGSAIFLASSAGKALVLRTLSASLLNQLGVEARAAGLDYRPSSLGVTLHGVSIRQSAAARAFLNAERVEADFSPAILRGTLVLRRLDVTKPEVVLDSTTQGASAVLAADREEQAHAPSSATVPSFDIQSGQVRDLMLTSVSPNGTHIAVRGLSLSFTGEGPGVVRGAVVVSGGWSVRRGTSEIGFDRHGRTCRWPERRWP